MIMSSDAFSSAINSYLNTLNKIIDMIDEQIQESAKKGEFSTKFLFTIDEDSHYLDALRVAPVLNYLRRIYMERGFRFSVPIDTPTTIKILINWEVPQIDYI